MSDEFGISAPITADDSGFQATFARIDKTLADFGINFEKMGEEGSSILKKFGVDIDVFAGKLGMSAPMLAGIVAAGAAIAEIGNQFDEASSKIGRATGATGKDLDNLNASFQVVMKSGVDASISEVADAFGALQTKLDLTGKPLEEITTKFAEFADINNTQLPQAVASVTDVINKWNIPTEQAGILLDQLSRASQISGVSVTDLAVSLKNSGAQFQNLGLSLTESLAMISAFGKDGVKAETVMMGLNTAIAFWTRDGREASTAMRQTFEQIKNAATPTEALTVAVQNFGTRAGPEMVTAIRSGKTSIADFQKTLEESTGTVEKTASATKTIGEMFGEFTNKLMASFEPLGKVLIEIAKFLMDDLAAGFDAIMKLLDPFLELISTTFDNIKQLFSGFVVILDGLVHGDWTKVWLGLKLVVLTEVKQITDVLSGFVNIFVNVINGMIERVNAVITKIGLKPIQELSKFVLADVLGITKAIDEAQTKIDALSKKKEEAVTLGAPPEGGGAGGLSGGMSDIVSGAGDLARDKGMAAYLSAMERLRERALVSPEEGATAAQGASAGDLARYQGFAAYLADLERKKERAQIREAAGHGSEVAGEQIQRAIHDAILQSAAQLPKMGLFDKVLDGLRTIGEGFKAKAVGTKDELTGAVSGGSELGNLFGKLTSFGDLIGGALSGLGGMIASLSSVQAVLNPLQTILGAAMKVLGPLINAALQPLVNILDTFGVILADTLVPVLNILTPVIQLVATVLGWLATYVIMPIGNAIISFYNGIAMALNAALGWIGVNIKTAALMTPDGVEVQVAAVQSGGNSSRPTGEYSHSHLGYARGTDYVPKSGYYRVGELGPETAYLRQGTKIVPAAQTAAGGRNFQVTNYITAPNPLNEAAIARQTRQDMRRLAAQGGA